MNKVLFRVLVVLMSLSLIGIIFVQVYWFNSSLENNQEQFKFHVKQVLGNVSEDIKNQEILAFVDKINQFKDSKILCYHKNPTFGVWHHHLLLN